MSKAKVEEYKNYKKNKKKILAKEKRKKIAGAIIFRLVGILIIAGIVFLVAYKGIDMYKDYLASRPNFTSDSLVIGDLCDLKGTEEETTEEETTESEETKEESETENTAEATDAETKENE